MFLISCSFGASGRLSDMIVIVAFSEYLHFHFSCFSWPLHGSLLLKSMTGFSLRQNGKIKSCSTDKLTRCFMATALNSPYIN